MPFHPTPLLIRCLLGGVLLASTGRAAGQTKPYFKMRQQMEKTRPAQAPKQVLKPSADFRKITLTRDFVSEGVAVADINRDGRPDIVAGYYWFEAPHWQRHELAPARTYDPWKEYSDSFLNLGLDVNLDGWDDVVLIDFPGKMGYWLENPQNKPGTWKKHVLADSMGIANESPAFVDIDGDGRLDILCGDPAKKQIVWLKAPTQPGGTRWTRHPLSAENVPGTDPFSHGIGYGDLDHDGLPDVVIRDGWFKGTTDRQSGTWVFHPASLGEPCSHMHVLDVNGDGKNDVVSASAHALGIWWYEQGTDETGTLTFKTHLMSTTTAQTHASILADLNGDGLPDYITGKRFLAHHGRDPGDSDPGILLWFELTPGRAPYYRERVIDTDSGAGLNITAHDMNGDGRPDLLIANKNGVFLFENRLKK
jgi:hypothetical protein